MTWSSAGLPVIVTYDVFWTAQDAAILFPPLSARQCRDLAAEAALKPVGRRPSEGRGRAALVYAAEDWVSVLCSG